MFRHVEPILRYLWSKGRVSDSNGKVSMVEPREYQPDQYIYFFFQLLSLPDLWFSISVTFTALCPAYLTIHPPAPNFGGVFPISPPTLLHHPCPRLPHQTPSKTSSALVTTLFFSLVQPLLDRFWGPCRSFELPVMFGRCPIYTPTPLHCISSLTYCPCHRKNRPTGERFFSLFFIEARKAPDKGPSLPSPSLLSHVLT